MSSSGCVDGTEPAPPLLVLCAGHYNSDAFAKYHYFCRGSRASCKTKVIAGDATCPRGGPPPLVVAATDGAPGLNRLYQLSIMSFQAKPRNGAAWEAAT